MTGVSAFLQSLVAAGFAEFGDKSQLLAFLLAARFRRPLPILAGVFLGTLACDAVGVVAGERVGELVPAIVLRWTFALSFLAIAAWILVPRHWIDDVKLTLSGSGVLVAASVSSFVAEFGDRTDVAAIALGARFDMLLPVLLGTAIGGFLADIPAVLGGSWTGQVFAWRWLRYAAAAVFVIEAGLSVALN